eukprot:TRINITY_DN296_c1_g1_i16.p1 TRINITY_DN296_c1_g1~~TRINITY_DN296_c1_g1_i16.p1  ORF type:complete len:316 (-),score=56.03 TRINITY_DN296_c1_g1_i16:1309-2256(-)
MLQAKINVQLQTLLKDTYPAVSDDIIATMAEQCIGDLYKLNNPQSARNGERQLTLQKNAESGRSYEVNCEDMIAEFVLGCRQPFSIVDHPKFRSMIRILSKRRFTGFGRTKLTTSVVPRVVKRLRESAAVSFKSSKFVPMCLDSGTTTSHEGITNIVIFPSNSHEVFGGQVTYTKEKMTGRILANKLTDKVNSFFPGVIDKASGFISDCGGKDKSGRSCMAEDNNALSVDCVCHGINNFAKKSSAMLFGNTVAQIKAVASEIRNKKVLYHYIKSATEDSSIAHLLQVNNIGVQQPPISLYYATCNNLALKPQEAF